MSNLKSAVQTLALDVTPAERREAWYTIGDEVLAARAKFGITSKGGGSNQVSNKYTAWLAANGLGDIGETTLKKATILTVRRRTVEKMIKQYPATGDWSAPSTLLDGLARVEKGQEPKRPTPVRPSEADSKTVQNRIKSVAQTRGETPEVVLLQEISNNAALFVEFLGDKLAGGGAVAGAMGSTKSKTQQVAAFNKELVAISKRNIECGKTTSVKKRLLKDGSLEITYDSLSTQVPRMRVIIEAK